MLKHALRLVLGAKWPSFAFTLTRLEDCCASSLVSMTSGMPQGSHSSGLHGLTYAEHSQDLGGR